MALSVTPGVSYARSFTGLVDPDGVGQVITNANLLSLASSAGPLRTLLSAAYATDGDLIAAFRNAGGHFALRLAAGTAVTTTQWTREAVTNLPQITLGAGNADTLLEMDMALYHTVSA